MFEFHSSHRIVYVITVILIPNLLKSCKKQAHRLNNKILKKLSKKKKKKKIPATGLEPVTSAW